VLLFSLELKSSGALAAARVLRKAAKDQLIKLGLENRELSLTLVSDRRIRAINKAHRGKDKATDVLSFPQEEPAKALRAQGPIGDVVISLDTAKRQAKEGKWPLAVELRRLLAHGLLHCLGHDHETSSDAKKMDAAERKLLGEEGLVGAAWPQLRLRTNNKQQ
jgi:probable rRNA maturation factor